MLRCLIVGLCLTVGSCCGALSGRRSGVLSLLDIPIVGACDKPATRAFHVVAAAYAAYNGGDAEQWADAQLAGEFHASAADRAQSRSERMRIFETAFRTGSRIAVLRCYSLGIGEWPGLAQEGLPVAAGHGFCCDTVRADAFHAGSGRDRIEAHRWVVDGGTVVAFLSPPPPTIWADFAAGFRTWLEVEHPDVGDDFVLAPGGIWPSASSVPAALRLVGAFVDASSEWPVPDAECARTPVVHRLASGIEVSITDPSQLDLVTWALDRFARAGLEPPPVARVEFEPRIASGRSQACFPGDPSGVASLDYTGGIITLWLSDEAVASPTGFSREERHATLHEFAHVWKSFLRVRASRSGPGPVFEATPANEYAAEVLAWALMDELIVPDVPPAPCEDLARSFELLTGVPAVDRLTDCRHGATRDAPSRARRAEVAPLSH
jgi:hypothetical protein